ncbi:NAD(P)/FAD-dependent oxidoreductase [Microvirga makkahensis]|uniref:NADH:ubiquinone reductase (non-electrogenic) n=1 Tax=Microvirga makkahensis TaxID=1128670 RepID=A0A7X3MSG2_9HYPH|nr:NAD(P)/FAD-dependent oxidoreductase [Microvirga makkahensis]MXQ12316.1 FAD-dependent oxidoreductase [Microvirga makkahensis]
MSLDKAHHVVIVGAGFAGLSLARSLGGTALRATVIDRRNYHLFQPLLYQIATAALSPGEIAQPIRRIRAEILTAFETAERGHDPAERERLMTFAIFGGGRTGVEMAGAIAGLARQALARDFRHIDPTKARILLIEAAPRILGPFPEDLSAYAVRALERLGVALHTGKPVEDVNERGVTIGDEFIPASTIVWAAGDAASPAGQWLHVGTDRAGRIAVAPDLSVPGLDNVYVLGDLALTLGGDGKPLPGLAQVARQQGHYLGKALLARILRHETPPPFRFHSRGNLAVIGRNEAVVHWDSLKLKGFIAWLVWGIAHVYLLVGFHNRFLVTMRWLWTYLTFQRGLRPDHRGRHQDATRQCQSGRGRRSEGSDPKPNPRSNHRCAENRTPLDLTGRSEGRCLKPAGIHRSQR